MDKTFITCYYVMLFIILITIEPYIYFTKYYTKIIITTIKTTISKSS
jgi:hypothetical protein